MKTVRGTLSKCRNKWRIIISYYDNTGKRKQKTYSTGLSIKGNKRKAKEMLAEKMVDFEKNILIQKVEINGMKNLRVSTNKTFGTVRHILNNGEMLFSGSDIIKALGFTNNTILIDCVEPDDKCDLEITEKETGRVIKETMVNYCGIQSLVCLCRANSTVDTKAFKNWLIRDIGARSIADNVGDISYSDKIILDAIHKVYNNSKDNFEKEQMLTPVEEVVNNNVTEINKDVVPNNIDYPEDLTGLRFGELTVVQKLNDGKNPLIWASRWICECDCGKITTPRRGNLISGNTKTCGCGKWRGKNKKSGDKDAG